VNARAAVAVLSLALVAPALAREDPAAPPQATGTPAATVLQAPSADAARAGHYYLQGVMETGSELRLSADGRFEWYFTYGALDLAARGRWRHQGADVVLEVEEFLAPPGYEAMKFDRLPLRADGTDLVPAWPWDDGAERGRYTRE
jgi:hypothetical protein